VAENGQIKLLRESLNPVAVAQALLPGGVKDLPDPEKVIFSVPQTPFSAVRAHDQQGWLRLNGVGFVMSVCRQLIPQHRKQQALKNRHVDIHVISHRTRRPRSRIDLDHGLACS
jgi:hypothetical protein